MTKETTFKVLNKHLMMRRYHPKGLWYLEANVFEAAKQALIAQAYGRLKQFLPYSYGIISWPSAPDEWPLRNWFEWLMPDNAPGKYDPSTDPDRFRALVEPLDFSKPYDHKVVESIRAQFHRGQRAPVVVDAAEIEGEANSYDQ